MRCATSAVIIATTVFSIAAADARVYKNAETGLEVAIPDEWPATSSPAGYVFADSSEELLGFARLSAVEGDPKLWIKDCLRGDPSEFKQDVRSEVRPVLNTKYKILRGTGKVAGIPLVWTLYVGRWSDKYAVVLITGEQGFLPDTNAAVHALIDSIRPLR